MRLKSPGTEKYALIQAQNEKEYREQERICKEEIDHFEKQISEVSKHNSHKNKH
jgi:hypothetical protein